MCQFCAGSVDRCLFCGKVRVSLDGAILAPVLVDRAGNPRVGRARKSADLYYEQCGGGVRVIRKRIGNN